jgi:hypothetical protein
LSTCELVMMDNIMATDPMLDALYGAATAQPFS